MNIGTIDNDLSINTLPGDIIIAITKNTSDYSSENRLTCTNSEKITDDWFPCGYRNLNNVGVFRATGDSCIIHSTSSNEICCYIIRI